MTATLTAEQKARLSVALDGFLSKLEASARRGRKDRELNPIYSAVEKEFKLSWKELAEDLKDEWADPGIAHTFEARRGPTKAQMDALYNRARQRADSRQKKAVDSNVKKVLLKGAASAQADLGPTIKWDIRSKAAEKWLKNRGADRVKDISDNSRKRIKDLVLKGAEQGKSYKEIGKEVEDLVKSWSQKAGGIQSRGELIAVTEMGEAYEQGRLQVKNEFEKKGVKTEKSWLTAGDQRMCPVCTVAEEDGWIPGNSEFSNGADAPLGHAGCRCDLLLQVA